MSVVACQRKSSDPVLPENAMTRPPPSVPAAKSGTPSPSRSPQPSTARPMMGPGQLAAYVNAIAPGSVTPVTTVPAGTVGNISTASTKVEAE